ncbi:MULTISPECIES: hypothetical protein [Flavobacterium]|uniref:Uncharacterized protein n=1 Tax=Flavobacterium hankyongi TaxID=1176532 RepID=A0ABP8ZT93_9FLAO|nr:hypothetical protein [Flavobacterium sp. N1846]
MDNSAQIIVDYKLKILLISKGIIDKMHTFYYKNKDNEPSLEILNRFRDLFSYEIEKFEHEYARVVPPELKNSPFDFIPYNFSLRLLVDLKKEYIYFVEKINEEL